MALTEREIFKQLCELDFAFYAKSFLKIVEPETEFKWNWHHDAVCNYCQKCFEGEFQNLDINVPPRQLKSLLVNVLFPTWIWIKILHYKVLSASRDWDLATTNNEKRRKIITSPEYQALWPIPIKRNSNAKDEFENEAGGMMKAISALGHVTGTGGDCLLSDDILDAQDAFSKAKRTQINRWYSQAFYNRAQDKKKVIRININQRLHTEDPSGNLEENHNFKKLVLPMVMTEENMSTVEGFKDPRQPGEFLFPERYGQDEMDDDFKALGSYGWSGQYQQRPTPIGGGIIKEEWLRFYKEKPKHFERIYITADLTFKKGDNSDFVAYQAWGESKKDFYLIDLVRGKWSYLESKNNFRAFCEKHPGASLKFIEDKANGPAMISELKKEMNGIRAWPETGSSYYNADKVTRLYLVSQYFEMGRVLLPMPELNNLSQAFVDELLSFTENGSTIGNDDMVDTMTMALLEFSKSRAFVAS